MAATCGWLLAAPMTVAFRIEVNTLQEQAQPHFSAPAASGSRDVGDSDLRRPDSVPAAVPVAHDKNGEAITPGRARPGPHGLRSESPTSRRVRRETPAMTVSSIPP